MEAEFLGVVDDPFGAERTGFSATTIGRAAFGVDIQLGFGGGNVVVADTIEIEFTIGPAMILVAHRRTYRKDRERE